MRRGSGGKEIGSKLVTPERWKKVEAVFEQAAQVPEQERSAFLERTCNGDAELRREVESLLNSHAQAGTFMEKRSLFFSSEMAEKVVAAVAPGQLIGAYRIVREIGRGGMGAVYLAERADEQYQKQVAIKLIKRGTDTESVLRHFRNERQILASFDHPNIARLFDGGTTKDGLPYFVMEYIEGIAIDQYCEKQPLAINQRLKLFLQVCAAVSYAHRHTVIHRDIKPSNILVTSDGVPKLLDFGIAKVLQASDGAASLMTFTGVRPMTPEYASPEQVRGELVTTASDVYSLGVALYELLTGTSPYRFTSHAPRDVERAITEQEPIRPSTATGLHHNQHGELGNRKLLRGDLDNILLMALRKEPARRYQTVDQFAEDIRRHLESRPVLARKDTIGYRTRKFVRRNKAATLAATLVFLSLVAGLIATTWEANRAKRRFNDVRQLAHSVLFDYYDAIKNLPGATRARERLVKDALTYLDSLAREAGGDSALQRELAAAYERVGDVSGEAYSASLGDRASALTSYQKALRIREALVAAAPRDLQSRRELASSYDKVGSELLETAQAARGMELIRNSLAIYSQLAAEKPDDPVAQRDLAKGYSDVAFALEGRGDVRGVLENYRKATGIFEALLRENPQDPALHRSLSVAYENSGRALFLSNNLPAALEMNQKALELRRALLTQDPTNAAYHRILGISYQNDGDYRAASKDITGALESFRKKLSLDEEAVAADPANAQAGEDLGYSNLRIGDLLEDSGEYSQALPYQRRALEIYVKNAAADPQDLPMQFRIAGVRAQLGKAQAKTGALGEAREQCRKAAELLQTVADDRDNVGLRRLRVEAGISLGDAYSALAALGSDSAMSDQRSACHMYQRSFEILQEMRTQNTLGADEVSEMDALAQKVAACGKPSTQ
jgi:eukaryotic-like serine/threonine-protein kinase